MPDDAVVARPISNKLKRQTKTLGGALGAVITELRVERQWSQSQLAQRSGYEASSISRIERGKTNPTMALVIVMADTFGLRPSQLLARAERKQLKNSPDQRSPRTRK